MKKRLTRLSTVLALAVCGLVLGAGPALAHDELESTTPVDGSSVKKLPDSVVLSFNADVLELGAVMRVEGPDGDIVEGKPTLKGNKVTQALAPGSPAGDYDVQWRVTSSDGHPISGEFSFTAAAGNTAAEEPTPTAEPTPTVVMTTEAATESTPVSSIQVEDPDGGAPMGLVITLGALAVLVLGATVYVFFIAPKRTS